MRIKRKLVLMMTCTIGLHFMINAQTGRVGINTANPKSTFDLNGQKGSGGVLLINDITGLQAPRVTREELTAKGNLLYGSDQKGTVIYINDVTNGDILSQRANITTIGYYYFDGTLWQKFADTKSVINPSGFERKPDMSSSNFYWRLIGASSANYGTEGKYGLDASWNPANLNEVFNGATTYSSLLTASGLTLANLGAMGKNSFTAGTMNSASGNGSTSLGAGNSSSGLGAFTAGISSSATNTGATALGVNNKATGIYAVAMGSGSTASGSAALTFGFGNNVSGASAVGIGLNNNLSGDRSYVLGENNVSTVSSANSSILGTNNTVSAIQSIAIGDTNNISGNNAVGLGNNLSAESMYSVITGFNNTLENLPQSNTFSNLAKRLFLVGNGLGGTKSDALTILRNGKTGIDIDNFETTASDAKLQINGTVKIATLSATSTCNSANEGSVQYLKTGAVGIFQGCVQSSATPTYAWVNLN